MQTSHIPRHLQHLKNYISHIFCPFHLDLNNAIFFDWLWFPSKYLPRKSCSIFVVSWPVTKVGMWDFLRNKFQISGICVWSYKAFWQTTLMQQCLTIVGEWCMVWTTCWQTPCCWERIIKKQPQVFCSVYGNAVVDWSTTGHWVRRVTAFKSGKQEHHD